ncbi:glutathione S-transferase [Pseudorhodobacter antarcticus]|jgi:glutathione S-transferase|uniref:Glutathione S-transferase n=1 Tax=Pseudorhodobacter antarcticus TaxID=1077947 RepID=A0A1H8G5X8_9RHOB|nr:glutathione S-transferase [Pseudorhodobacter antarcticus]SEN39426.1 glutathione S-transferase [Pseudorhodobacter antarcticus]
MIRLHHIAQSRSFRILWLLEEIGLPFDLIPHAFDKTLRDPAYLALSPVGRVPALEIDGQALFESGAIAEYLVETRAPHLMRGPGQAGRSTYLEWVHFGETIGQHLANLTQHNIALREDCMRSPTVMRLEAKRLANCLEAVAAQAGDGYVAEDFSAADIQCGYGLWLGQRFVRLSTAAQQYLNRLTARPAFRAALAKDGPAKIYTRDFYPAPEA